MKYLKSWNIQSLIPLLSLPQPLPSSPTSSSSSLSLSWSHLTIDEELHLPAKYFSSYPQELSTTNAVLPHYFLLSVLFWKLCHGVILLARNSGIKKKMVLRSGMRYSNSNRGDLSGSNWNQVLCSEKLLAYNRTLSHLLGICCSSCGGCINQLSPSHFLASSNKQS